MTGWRLVAISVASGALAGSITLGLIKRRLAFHAAETPFAADALDQEATRSYLSAWLCTGLVAAGFVFAIVSWRALPLFVASFAIGAALATTLPDRQRPTVPSSHFRGRSKSLRAIAAILVAGLLWLVMIRMQGTDGSIIATLLLLIGIQLLAPLDGKALRFEGVYGVSLMSSLRRHLGSAALWYGAVLAIGASRGMAAWAAPFAIAAGALLVHVARLLACRVTSERNSIIIVGGMLVLCGTIVALSPGYEWLALPVGLSGLGWLLLRALRDRWLMA